MEKASKSGWFSMTMLDYQTLYQRVCQVSRARKYCLRKLRLLKSFVICAPPSPSATQWLWVPLEITRAVQYFVELWCVDRQTGTWYYLIASFDSQVAEWLNDTCIILQNNIHDYTCQCVCVCVSVIHVISCTVTIHMHHIWVMYIRNIELNAAVSEYCH